VISLPQAVARRDAVARRLTAAGLPFELLDAVDGNALGASDLARYSEMRALYRLGRGLTHGELAAALSHMHAYERMLREGRDHVVVLEDDAVPMPGLADVLESVSSLPGDWDVLTLHSTFASAGPEPIGISIGTGAFEVCTYRRMVYGAVGYLVRRRAARRLVEVGYPIFFPADDLLTRAKPAGLRIYGVEPAPVGHEGGPSEVGRATRRKSVGHVSWPLRSGVVVAGKVVRHLPSATRAAPRPRSRTAGIDDEQTTAGR
jgi:GR25 family glycosyltransferase involved in LPS biosynthesis